MLIYVNESQHFQGLTLDSPQPTAGEIHFIHFDLDRLSTRPRAVSAWHSSNWRCRKSFFDEPPGFRRSGAGCRERWVELWPVGTFKEFPDPKNDRKIEGNRHFESNKAVVFQCLFFIVFRCFSAFVDTFFTFNSSQKLLLCQHPETTSQMSPCLCQDMPVDDWMPLGNVYRTNWNDAPFRIV